MSATLVTLGKRVGRLQDTHQLKTIERLIDHARVQEMAITLALGAAFHRVKSLELWARDGHQSFGAWLDSQDIPEGEAEYAIRRHLAIFGSDGTGTGA